MDAHAVLTSHGWRGKGHSLHPTSDTAGLSRPILVSQKQNNLGVGKKQHKTSDMWWMNAFDKSLQALDTSEPGKVVQTITSGNLDMVVKAGGRWVGTSGGLYTSFVKGEALGGTIRSDVIEESGNEELVSLKRRGDEGPECREKRRKRKASIQALRIDPVGAEDMSGLERKVETREERKSRKVLVKAYKKRKAVAKEEVLKRMEIDKASENIEMNEKKKARIATEKALDKQCSTAEVETVNTQFDEAAEKSKTTGELRLRKDGDNAAKAQNAYAEGEIDKLEVDEIHKDIETKEVRRKRKRQKKLLHETTWRAMEEASSSKAQRKKRQKD